MNADGGELATMSGPAMAVRRNPPRNCRSRPALTEEQRNAILNAEDSSSDESYYDSDGASDDPGDPEDEYEEEQADEEGDMPQQ